MLSIWILIAATAAFWNIRRRRVRAHRCWMIGAHSGLIIGGVFTLLPDRVLGQLVRSWFA